MGAYALADYLISGRARDSGTVLNGPVGYANALGIMAAIGVVLGVGI